MGITTARSKKKDKQLAHRKERRLVKAMFSSNCLCERLRDRRAVSNVYTWAKDGKQGICPDDARCIGK